MLASAWWVKGALFALAGLAGDLRRRALPLTALAALAAMGLASLLTSAVKDAVGRVRPPLEDATIQVIGALHSTPSFPSGHASTAFAAAVALAVLAPRLRAPALALAALAALVAVSRVYLGAHFWLDVLAGAALGALVGLLVVGAARRLAPGAASTEEAPLVPRRTSAALVVATAALALPASATAQDGATVTVVHGIPDTPVDVYANGERLLDDFQPETVTDPLSLPAGDYALALRPADSGADADPILSADATVESGQDVSVVAHLNAESEPTITPFANDTGEIPAGQARVTVRHTAAAPAVDVLAGGDPIIEGLENPNEDETTTLLVVAAAALLAWPGPGGADVGSLAELGPEVEEGMPAPRIADVPDLAAALPRESPLAARVRTRSAQPEDLPRRRVRPPRSVHVPALGVRSPVVAVGVRGRARELALPNSARRVAWYRFGPHPGARGTAVLAAHADWQGRPGPFVRLAALEPGDRVRVGFRRGEARAFRVIARRSYDKGRLPRRLFATAGRPALALVTCGGPFDRRTRTYARNTVVWAVPA